jgi:hypothetical protein
MMDDLPGPVSQLTFKWSTEVKQSDGIESGWLSKIFSQSTLGELCSTAVRECQPFYTSYVSHRVTPQLLID